ncbi:hypothetical protein J2X69_003600 [Algoriphagus sp. 4150]|nr:hypothetical protein [Algoriphagus sp. 4150]
MNFAQSPQNFAPPEHVLEIWVTKVNEKITVDGKLDEVSWSNAHVVNDFFRMEPRQGGTVKFPTEVKILFDETHLYIGAFCKDSLGKKGVRVQDLRRDFIVSENDRFSVQLDPQNLKRFNVSFQTTPYGNQLDLQVFDDSFRDSDWDALWKVRTSLVDSGYMVEMAIPFKSLRYDNPEGEEVSWGITLARLARREYEKTVFPAIPQAFSPDRMTYAAQLKGLELPPPSLNFRIQPYGLIQVEDIRNQNGEQTSRTQWKAGGEIKWAVSPSAVLDLTYNTDFAQADVDRAVNNLTRFNVYFPERRQFFLENSGVYAGADNGAIRPFFSRTIGLSNSQFNADPVPINGGIRYTDRNQKRTLAAMYVHQQGTDFQSPVSFSVLRYLKNYGKQNNIGVMLNQRFDERSAELGTDRQSNTTLTVDGLIRPNDNWTIQYLASSSRENSYDSLGFAGSLFVGYTPNKWYLGWLSNMVDRKYQPGMGFVFGQNIIHHNPGGYFIWRPTKGWFSKWIRRADPGVFVNWYQTANTLQTQEISLEIFPVYIFTRSNGMITYTVIPSWQNFEFSFPILDQPVQAGRYQNIRHQFQYRTDQSRKLSANAIVRLGDYYNGDLNSFSLTGRFAPIPHASLEVNYEYNDFEKFGSELADFSTSLYSVGVRLAANPRLQLSGFYQYNNFDSQGRINLRGSWEFAPLSFLYVVFNESRVQETTLRNQSTISKVSFLKQF